jgi:hypothetical protein
MSKISNTAAYPNATPLIGDYVIGTVASSLETKTFTIGDIIGLVSDNTLSEVLAAGNTATNDITLTGNITCTSIIPTDIQDGGGNTGTAGQALVKSLSNALEWVDINLDLESVLAAGNTATNDIDLTGNLEVDGDVTISSTIFLDGLIDIGSAIPLRMTAITAYDDDAAAALAGLTQGDVYQTTAANPNGAGVLMVKQ